MKISFSNKKFVILSFLMIQIFCTGSKTIQTRKRIRNPDEIVMPNPIKKAQIEEETQNINKNQHRSSYVANTPIYNETGLVDYILDLENSYKKNSSMEEMYQGQLPNGYAGKNLIAQDKQGPEISTVEDTENQNSVILSEQSSYGLLKSTTTEEQQLHEFLEFSLNIEFQQESNAHEILSRQDFKEHFEFGQTPCEQIHTIMKEDLREQIKTIESEHDEIKTVEDSSYVQSMIFFYKENPNVNNDLALGVLNTIRDKTDSIYYRSLVENFLKMGNQDAHLKACCFLNKKFDEYIKQKVVEMNKISISTNQKTVDSFKNQLTNTKELLYHLEFIKNYNIFLNNLFKKINKCVAKRFLFFKKVEHELKDEDYENFITQIILKNESIAKMGRSTLFTSTVRSKFISNIILICVNLLEHLKERPELIVLERITNSLEDDILFVTYYRLSLLEQLITDRTKMTNTRAYLINRLINLFIRDSLDDEHLKTEDFKAEIIFSRFKSHNEQFSRCKNFHINISYIILIICSSERLNILKNKETKGCFTFDVTELEYFSFIMSFIIEKRIMINDWIIRKGLNKTECTLREKYIELKKNINEQNKCYGCLFNSFYDMLSTNILTNKSSSINIYKKLRDLILTPIKTKRKKRKC